MVDATNDNLIPDVELLYVVDNGEEQHSGPPNNGEFTISIMSGSFVYISANRPSYNERSINGYITEDKTWTIALPPMVLETKTISNTHILHNRFHNCLLTE